MFRLSVAAVCSATLLALAPPASAAPEEQDPSRPTAQAIVTATVTPDSTLAVSSTELSQPVVLTNPEGVTILNPAGEASLEELLENHGYRAKDFRGEDNLPLSKTNFDLSKPVLLFGVSYEGATTRMALTAPVVKRKTSDLLVGETAVEQEGVAGLALKTSVKVKSSAEDVKLNARAKTPARLPTVETLTVVQAPKPRIVLVGTGVEEVETPSVLPEQGVDAPTQTVATGDLARLRDLNRDNPLLLTALSKVGSPYVWGATGPSSFDCSGFVLWAFSQHGYQGIPRTSTAQGGYATPVSWSDVQPGDLIWRPGHVGIYAGGGVVVHAANPSSGVTIAPVSWFTSNGFHVGRFPRR